MAILLNYDILGTFIVNCNGINLKNELRSNKSLMLQLCDAKILNLI